MKRVFAETVENSELFDSTLDGLSDDFDYVVEGLETLARHSKDGERAAIGIMNSLSDAVSDAMKSIADSIEGE